MTSHAERNLRLLAAISERAGSPVVACYRQDLVDILRELEQARAAAVAALEHGMAPAPLVRVVGRG